MHIVLDFDDTVLPDICRVHCKKWTDWRSHDDTSGAHTCIENGRNGFLDIAKLDGLPKDLQRRIEGVFRHYPSEEEFKAAARANSLADTTLLSPPWLEPEPG